MPEQEQIKIGISSCLLGEKVRYDGNHKHDGYLTETLGQYFSYVPVCPETAIGMGVPRDPIRLVGDPEHPEAVGVDDPTRNVTRPLIAYGRKKGREMTGISGYIFKSKSPSCGVFRAKVYQEKGPSKNGRGLYAAGFMDTQPLLPVEEEGRLNDPVLRENFIERVFVYHRWQQLNRSRMTAGKLVEFHTAHKLLLMSHGTEPYREIGRMLADAGKQPIRELANTYIASMMGALQNRATRRRHTNVLQHLMGYLKRELDSEDKQELLEVIDRYRVGQLPLIVPITLLKHHFRRHPDPYVDKQVYLNPHPQELMLRNQL